MKTKHFALFFGATILAFSGLASADTIGDKISAAAQQLSDDRSTMNDLLDTAKKLKQTEDDINFGVNAFKKQADSYAVQKSKFEQRAAAVVAERNAHDARPPNRTCAACVNSYNNEARQIDRKLEAVRSDGGQLEKTRSLLQELQKTLTDKTSQWAIDTKENNARINEVAAHYAKVYDQLQFLKSSYEDCQKVLVDKRASLERIKLECGNVQFDGASRGLAELSKFPARSGMTPNN